MQRSRLAVTSVLRGLLLAVAATCVVPWTWASGVQLKSRWVLRASGDALERITFEYNLKVIRGLAPDLYLVDGPEGYPLEQLRSEVRADPLVQGFELDRPGRTPETASSAPIPAVDISGLLQDRRVALFGGVPAWIGYVDQTAARLVKLNGPDAKFRILDTAKEWNDLPRYLEEYFKKSGDGVTVAIIDTGVDANHPVLKPVMLPGFDFTRGVAGVADDFSDLDQSTSAILDQCRHGGLTQSTSAILDACRKTVLNQSTSAILDGNGLKVLNQSTSAILDGDTEYRLRDIDLPAAFGHGTMVAGLIHLAAPNARIMPLKAFHADGSSNTADVVQAIYYATDHGAKVISMSFSFEDLPNELFKAVNYAQRRGAICVSSVGNDGKQSLAYPAALPNVISVGSSSPDDQEASTFSNVGVDLVKVAAPGESLVTTFPGGHYAVVSGTSFSTGIVAGTVALIAETRGQKKDTDFYRALYALAHAKYIPGLGYGRIDIGMALYYANKALK